MSPMTIHGKSETSSLPQTSIIVHPVYCKLLLIILSGANIQLTTAAPSAAASFLALRRTSPRSPITVSRTTSRSSPSSAAANGEVEARTRSQRPKAQLRIHHCCRRASPSWSESAPAPAVGVGVKWMKPFTRYTLSFGSWRRAEESAGSSSGGSGALCAVVDSSGWGWG